MYKSQLRPCFVYTEIMKKYFVKRVGFAQRNKPQLKMWYVPISRSLSIVVDYASLNSRVSATILKRISFAVP